MGQFALNVYDASWAWKGQPAEAAKKMGLENAEDVLFTWFEDKSGDDHCPKFMIFNDDESKSIVLAVRGTYSFSDVIVDVICDEEEFLAGYAHRGIYRGARRIMKEGGEVLSKALEENPDYRLIETQIILSTCV